MQKTNPQNLTADWSVLSYRPPRWSVLKERPPWEHVTSAELAKVLGKHLQTINNWKIRGILPEPDADTRKRGNKNYFRIATIRSWLEGRDEFEIISEWVKRDMQTELTDGQVRNLIGTLYKTPNVGSRKW